MQRYYHGKGNSADYSGFGELVDSDAWANYWAKYRYLMRYWPFVGSLMQGYDSAKDWDTYLKTHDMQWKDIQQWSKMGGSGYSGTFNMVSKNLLALYK